ncbi:MAG TPA: hypothetical protein VFZ26_05155 [Gemmatimonadales bacterium]
MNEPPDDFRELERTLGAIRFEPRASLGPEIAGRVGEQPPAGGDPGRRPRFRRAALAAAAAIAAAAVVLAPGGPLRSGPERVTVDRCCYDLDGGGEADDGVLIEAERDDRVHRLRVYEDRDRSSDYSAGDLLRLDRGAELALQGHGLEGLVTIERCCLDFDGGGPSDDGLLVLGVPPDRVVMAAIYERRDSPGGGTWGAPLR